MRRASAEQEAVVRALREHGIVIDDPEAAQAVARTVVRYCEQARRRHTGVAPMQCGAPTRAGWPCQNERIPGQSGCRVHRNWRERSGG